AALLSNGGATPWCPFAHDYDLDETCLETDFGAHYYRKYFYGFSHQNWFHISPTSKSAFALSVRKDSKDLKKLRVVLRTNHSLRALKGFVNLNALRADETAPSLRALLELLLPRRWTRDGTLAAAARLGADAKSDELLLKLDELLESRCFKIGVLYARDA